MLVSASELRGLLDSPDLVMADCRSFKEYSEGHVPGAVHLDVFAFHWADTSAEGMAGFERQARGLLSMIGAGPGRRLVFYDSVSGMLAARGLWMALYLSHTDAAMLDGGISAWRAGGHPVESGTNAYRPSEFRGRPDPSLVAGYEHVRDSLGSAVIIDARSPGEYGGTIVRAARAGRIPGAVNVDWNGNLAPDGTLRPDAELSGLYDIPRDAPVITYCQGAYRAANAFVALKKLGFPDVRVYLGSWGEWGNRPDLPVEP